MQENQPDDTCRISQSTISKPVAGMKKAVQNLNLVRHDFGYKPLLLGDTLIAISHNSKQISTYKIIRLFN